MVVSAAQLSSRNETESLSRLGGAPWPCVAALPKPEIEKIFQQVTRSHKSERLSNMGKPMLYAPIHSVQSASAEAPKRILLVEDDGAISQLLIEILDENGFSAYAVASASEMDRILEQDTIDLIVLDVMLPGEDGFSICRRVRASSAIPIIMLTALDEPVDRIIGLEIGADDYVAKPFNPRELVARIRALLRRTHSGSAITKNQPQPLRFAGWRIFPRERQLYSPDGIQVTPTSAEFDLLLAFCQHPGRILSREQLLELTHGGLAGPIERSVDVHVSRIRQKIEPDPRDPVLIKTVRLGGYVFTASVEAFQ
jgi:two-component system, OmpR family, response regulator